MRRPKRTAQVKAHITPDLKEQLELFLAEETNSNILSMSDYLFGVLEDHVAHKAAIRQVKQRSGRRAGNQ
jgi:hypothetical protein